MAPIRVKGISRFYGSKAVLQNVSLDIHDSELMVFVGPSGCGKSTLLRTIAGLENPDTGEVWIDEQLVNSVPPGDRHIAMVFQNYALYPHMTVAQNLGFCLKNMGVSNREIEKRVMETAQILQIEPLLNRKPHQMSGGQRQRVAIGRAIIRNPKVYLFDEPLSNLDAKLRVQMRVELARLHQQFCVTTIYVTHDQVEAMTLADRIAVMNAGRFEQVGPPLELYDHPKNLFVAGFLGSPPMNFVPGELVSAARQTASIRIGRGVIVTAGGVSANHLNPGSRVTVGIRPEQLNLSRNPEDAAAEVNVVECLGDRSFLYGTLETEAQPVPVVLEYSENRAAGLTLGHLRPGSMIHVSAPAEQVHVFDERGNALVRETFSFARSA